MGTQAFSLYQNSRITNMEEGGSDNLALRSIGDCIDYITSTRPWGISKPVSEKENKKHNLSLIANMYSTDSLFCSIKMYTPEWLGFSQRNGRKQILSKQLLETIRSEKSGREVVSFVFWREEGFPRWHNDKEST